MNELPLARIFIYSSVTVVVAVALSIFTFFETQNVIAMTIVMGAATTIGAVIMSRWWMRLNRERGIPAAMPGGKQWTASALLFAAVAAIVAIEFAVYGISKSRVAEGASGIFFSLPIGLFALPAMYRRMRPVMAIETATWRMTYRMQIVLSVIFVFNLGLALARTTHFALHQLNELTIAAYFSLLTIMPFSARLMRHRYLEAKASHNDPPFDRWQAYNDRLAGND